MADGQARKDGMALPFGAELRRLRGRAGLSLRALAREVRYNEGHLSRVERGLRLPSVELARICDRAVNGQGSLLRLLPGSAASPPATAVSHQHTADPAPASDAEPCARSAGEADPWIPDRRDSAAVAVAFRNTAWQLRLLGREVPTRVVLPMAAEQVRTLKEIALAGRNPDRVLLRLAAHTAEFAGWMAQEGGLEAAARCWTAEAGRLAARSGFDDLRGYSLVRRAELEMYAGRADAVIELCEAVYHHQRYGPRVRAFAAQRAAQGHAMRGEEQASLRALDRARTLWAAQPDEEPDGLLLGSATVGDPAQLVSGWCSLDLGRPRKAVELLHIGLRPARTAQGRRMRALFGARAARALVADGELHEAVQLGRRSLRSAEMTWSATATTELHLLARALEQAPRHGPATELVHAIRFLSAPSAHRVRAGRTTDSGEEPAG